MVQVAVPSGSIPFSTLWGNLPGSAAVPAQFALGAPTINGLPYTAYSSQAAGNPIAVQLTGSSIAVRVPQSNGTNSYLIVQGSGLSLPNASLNGVADFTNGRGTVSSLQLYSGGVFSGGSVSGGVLIESLAFSTTHDNLSIGDSSLIIDGAGLPTGLLDVLSMLEGAYAGPSVNISQLSTVQGAESFTEALTSGAYTYSIADPAHGVSYAYTLTGTNLPTLLTAADLNATFSNQTLPSSTPALNLSQIQVTTDGQTATLALTPTGYTVTRGDYSLSVTGTFSSALTANQVASLADGNNPGGLALAGTAVNTVLHSGSGDDVIRSEGAGAGTVLDGGAGNDTLLVDGGSVNPNQGPLLADFSAATLLSIENITIQPSDGLPLVAVFEASQIGTGLSHSTHVTSGGGACFLAINASPGESLDISGWTFGNFPSPVSLGAEQGGASVTGSYLGDAIFGSLAGKPAEVLRGGVGDDTYYLYSTADQVIENPGEGLDKIVSSVSQWSPLADNVENLTLVNPNVLTGAAQAPTGAAPAIGAVGNSLANVITGNDADNVLDGGAGPGADTLVGGAGNDTYVVHNSGDVIDEGPGGGLDIVNAYASYTLPDNVEQLWLQGSGNLNGTGNSGDNGLSGNSGDNVLDGGGGNDWLIGNGGNDTLIGGAGIDDMAGGAGNDTYYVDNVSDQVVENPNEGIDTIISSVSLWTPLPDSVENLTITGAAIGATGNSLNNVITGDAQGNVIDGGGGADTMIGGAGNDTYHVDNAGDVVTELSNAGTDTIISSVNHWNALEANVENLTITDAAVGAVGNGLNNVITGDGLGNYLDGGTGIDTLVGGDGSDWYVVHNSADVITETPTGGVADFVTADVSYVLPDNVEQLWLQGPGNLNGTGNGGDNGLAGTVGDNTLDGGAGNDWLAGFGGNDTLIGGPGNDWLDGGTGADTMSGGPGNDIYIVDNIGDVIIENPGEGTDAVAAYVTYTLSANVEQLWLQGSGDINGTGNAGDNGLVANAGNDTLDGQGGNDWLVGGSGLDTLIGGTGDDTMIAGSGLTTLIGGTGNDAYVVNNAADVITEQPGEGNDSVASSVSYILPDNVENLFFSQNQLNLNGTGNASDNILQGNNGANQLSGLGGNDTLIGLGGNDTLTGGLGHDTFIFTAGLGNSVITDFTPGGANGDTLDLSALFAAGDAVSAPVQVGSDAVFTITDAGQSRTITLAGVTAVNLTHSADFHFYS